MINLEKSTKFFPAFFVDIVNDGDEYAAGTLPLHMTLFPPIQEPFDPSYVEEMRHVLNPLKPFDVTVGEDDYFGSARDIIEQSFPVKRIEPSVRLQKVHNGLVFTLGTLLHDSGYRQPYNPHVSVESFDQLQTGTKIHIGGFALVEKTTGEPWIVRGKVGFKGGLDG